MIECRENKLKEEYYDNNYYCEVSKQKKGTLKMPSCTIFETQERNKRMLNFFKRYNSISPASIRYKNIYVKQIYLNNI